jgi:hypothetical protein
MALCSNIGIACFFAALVCDIVMEIMRLRYAPWSYLEDNDFAKGDHESP